MWPTCLFLWLFHTASTEGPSTVAEAVAMLGNNLFNSVAETSGYSWSPVPIPQVSWIILKISSKFQGLLKNISLLSSSSIAFMWLLCNTEVVWDDGVKESRVLCTEEMLAQMPVPKLYLLEVDLPQSRGIKTRSRNADVFSLSPLLSEPCPSYQPVFF